MVRRTLTITVDGDHDLAADYIEAVQIVQQPPGHGLRVRWEHQLDFLDDDGNVIPPEAIIAALKELRHS